MDKPGWKNIEIGGITEAGSSANFKTGDWRSRFPIHLKDKCTNCMLCVVYCPDDCIMVKEGKIDYVDYEYCKGCGICFQVCPVKAIKMDDETKFEEFKKNPKKFEVSDLEQEISKENKASENILKQPKSEQPKEKSKKTKKAKE